MTDDTRLSLLFVCMGNICRSPLAECVFMHHINRRQIADRFRVDSAGTGGWHVGHPPDPRMREVGDRHGITVQGAARQVCPEDFESFDLIICMDHQNREYLLDQGAPVQKVSMLLEYLPDATMEEVPDPYYGAEDGFELVYELVDRACASLAEKLLNESGTNRA